MKKMHQFMTILATAVLAACSSMDVSDEKALSENFPADFNSSVYMNLHPALHTVEVRDYVSDANAKLKDSLGDAFAAVAAADSVAFVGDTASVHKILVEIGGYTEKKWETIWMTKEVTTIDTVKEIRMVSCKLTPISKDGAADTTADAADSAAADTTASADDSTADSTNVSAADSAAADASADASANRQEKPAEVIEIVVIDTAIYVDGSLKTVIGKTDSTGESVEYEISDSTYELVANSQKRDTTIVKIDSVKSPVPGSLAGSDLAFANSFNLYGVANDYDALSNIKSDEFAISYQYVLFGQAHGWAYRPCTEEEKTHPIQSEVYPMKKYYCDDNGIAKEI